MKIEVKPKGVLIALCAAILVLLSLNLLGIISKYGLGHDQVYGLVLLFDFDAEVNVPTFYSAFMLAVCSVLLAVITHVHRRLGEAYLAWGGLSLIFLFLSIDEIASIHERFIVPMRSLLNASGFLFYAWVVPYAIALVILMVLYSGFLRRLPGRIMRLFLLSGAIYVSGALGIELISGRHASRYGTENYSFALICTLEETLEMIGVAAFIYSLLKLMTERFSDFGISIVDRES